MTDATTASTTASTTEAADGDAAPHVLYPVLAGCAAEAARVARGVRAEQLGDPTPCAEFDVRALLNHWILYTSHGLEHRALRTPLPAELTTRDFTADPGWAAAYDAQLRRALAAWSEPAAWVGEVDTGYTTMPAEQIIRLLIKELVVHGWDVATATGQRIEVSDTAAAVVLDTVVEHGEIYRQYQGFAAAVAVPAGASTLARALAESGRDPGGEAVDTPE